MIFINKSKLSFVVIVLILILIGKGTNCNANQEEFEDAINAIDNWLNSIPKNQYKATTEDKVFNMKLKLVNGDVFRRDGRKAFIILNDLLEEIDNSEFKYDIVVFNEKSIRCLQLYKYVNYLEDSSNVTEKTLDITPREFFEERYEFYKKHITNKREQWEWLNGFLQVLSYNDSIFGSPPYFNENYINNFVENNYNQAINILKQYIAVSKYLLERDPNRIGYVGYYYTNIWHQPYRNMEVGIVLDQLNAFVYSWNKYLKEEDKKIILNFILPKYKDNKEALRIYSKLAN